jgi:hypothetical protein
MATILSTGLRWRPFLWLVLTFSVALSSNAYAQGAEIERFVFLSPSNTDRTPPVTNKAVLYWSCYLINTSVPLNCSFDFTIVGVRPGGCPDPNNPFEENACNNGGHFDAFHTATRPKGSVEFPQGNVDPDRIFVEGQTLSPTSDRAKILYRVPQVSGVYDVESRMTVPRGFFCVNTELWPCNTPTSWFVKGETNVGVPLLRQLPDPGPNDAYDKGRNPADPELPAHPETVAYAGTPFTLLELPFLAKDFFDLSGGLRIGVNDMSLPLGGVFDIIPTNWVADHIEHRDGTDVDINRPVDPVTGNRIDCEQNFALRFAVDQRLAPLERGDELNKNRLTALLCESEGRQHIDMEPLAF